MLDAGETVTIDADIAHDIGSQRSLRIRAAVLIEQIDAGQMQIADRAAGFQR